MGKIIGVLSNSSPVQTTPDPQTTTPASPPETAEAPAAPQAQNNAPMSPTAIVAAALNPITVARTLAGAVAAAVRPSPAPAAPAQTTPQTSQQIIEELPPPRVAPVDGGTPAFQGINPRTPIRLAQYFRKASISLCCPATLQRHLSFDDRCVDVRRAVLNSADSRVR
jgi:hypothetical protein